MSLYRRGGKRALDLTLTVPALAVLLPVGAVVGVLVRARLGSPIFFRQRRPGLEGQTFELLKFRTMTDARDEHGELFPDETRLTDFGRFLRRTSLDELPTFLNVLRGEMSLVGPRPLLVQYLSRYTSEQARRHETRPGVTGWTQINGRNAISWDEKFKLDLWYVDHVSMGLDLTILLRTALAVVTQRGITAEGHVTMPEFMGDRKTNGRSNGHAEAK